MIKKKREYLTQTLIPFQEGTLCTPCQHIERRCESLCKSPCIPTYDEYITLSELFGSRIFQKSYLENGETKNWDRIYVPLPVFGGYISKFEYSQLIRIISLELQDVEYLETYCVFFNSFDSTCLLHDIGLKPYLGRMVTCTSSKKDYDYFEKILFADWFDHTNEIEHLHIHTIEYKGE